MKIGVRAHDFGKDSPESLAAAIKSAGYEAAHLALFKALSIAGEDMYKQETVKRVRRAFEDAGVEISVLGCYVEPGSMDDGVYEDGLEKFRAHLKIAKALGAHCVATETTRFSGPEPLREAAYRRVLAFVGEMASEAERQDTYAAIEPVLAHTVHTPEMVQRLIRETASPRLKVIFDPVNLLSPTGGDDQKALWERCFACFGKDIAAVHIKDGRVENGRYIPLPLGEGVMAFAPVMDWLRLHHAGLPLLREEANPALAAREIRFMRGLLTESGGQGLGS